MMSQSRHSQPLRYQTGKWVFYVCTFLTSAAILAHIFGWSLYVPAMWFPVLFLILLGSALLGYVWDVLTPFGSRPWWKTLSMIAATVLLAAGYITGITFLAIEGQQVIIFRWPWYATMITAGATVFMIYIWAKGE